MSEQRAYWFVAKTRHGAELGVRNRLAQLGVESYIPTRMRRSSRGTAMVEEPLLTSFVFLHATKREALDLVHSYGLKANLVNDCATHRLMFVADKCMEDFRRVLEASIEEGGLVDKPLSVGEKVRVTQGVLRGVEGYALEIQGRIYVVVGLLNCLFARARVPRAWLEKI
ncbi:MAG: UpxY family transcription antiterminator [Bacteroidales bacterium]|nr:UpxY family transcription antiterminator [Bacteroidales bacterium]